MLMQFFRIPGEKTKTKLVSRIYKTVLEIQNRDTRSFNSVQSKLVSMVYNTSGLVRKFCIVSENLGSFPIDTCCIDKSNSTEFGEAINSMFSWYRKSTKCYVYMSDVSTNADGRVSPN